MKDETGAVYEVLPDPPIVAVSEQQVIKNAADAWMLCKDLAKEDREHFIVLFLDARHRMIGERWIAAIGNLTGVEARPRETLREALLRNACAIIIAHNHPSQDPTPSKQDRVLTETFRDACKLIGFALLDHIVVASTGYISIANIMTLG